MREKLNVKSNMVMIIIRFLSNNPKLRLEYLEKIRVSSISELNSA